ncbi:MAG: hypothetical protein JSS49_21235 [Planctomycetes bacterium]|nr:hypothetical protein [Planctomycetota bacterium]
MPDESNPTSTALQERRLQSRLLRLRAQRQETERHRVANESINTLLSVVKYLNSVQDGDALRIDGTYSRTDIDKPSRILNCHEEDIMNASLIAMKRLIMTLIPAHADVQQIPSLTAVNPVTSAEL